MVCCNHCVDLYYDCRCMQWFIIASAASFLVHSIVRIFAIYIGIYKYIYVSGRTSFRKCSKCFYVYLNICPMRYSAMQI